MAMRCARCGAELRSGASFCGRCGQAVGAGSAPSPEQGVQGAAQPVQPQVPQGAAQPVQPQAPYGAAQPVQPQAPYGAAQAQRQGVDVRAEHLTRYRGLGRKRRKTNDDITLHVRPGEFVAIIGGSGSGKSTLLNELNGREPADEGTVLIDGVDLYANFERLRGSIGFVPQQDIIHDNLTLGDTLRFAARMRMPHDTPDEVREQRIQQVLAYMHLEDEQANMVGRLSGGQKKRASIAVELLNDPRLLFLDEPTSGLDPSLERELMHTLAAMAKDGRTVLLVTHTPANLDLCDKLVVLGKGGRLCYFGAPQGAREFFGKADLVDVYDEISSEEGASAWQQRYAALASRQMDEGTVAQARVVPAGEIEKPEVGQQLRTLVARYVKLILNDHSRLFILLAQAPLLAFLIAFVAGKGCFEIYENTKSCLFDLSCAAFWVGIFDSIQEVCKERPIFERECDSGIRVSSYVLSKLVVLGCVCVL